MGIVKSSIIVTVFNAISIFLGFFSNIIVASKFGAKTDMDMFLAASTMPLYINSILTGVISFSFIPVFAEYKNKSTNESWVIVSSFINISIIVTLIITILGIIFSNGITEILYPGFSNENALHISFLQRWYLPTIIFTLINELMAGVYYSNGKFLTPSINKLFGPFLTVLFVFLLAKKLNTQSIVIAILVSTVLQTIFLAIGFIKNETFSYRLVIDLNNPGVKKIIRLMIPLLLGTLVYRGISIFDRFILSGFSEGSISIVNYSSKIISIIPPLIVTGISTAIFPKLSEFFTDNNIEMLANKVEQVIKFLSFIILPLTAIISLFSNDIVRIIFERGQFTPIITQKVSEILSFHILILWPSCMGIFLGQCFYSIQRTKISSILGVSEAVIYMLICFPLSKSIGIHGLIYATIIDWYLSLFLSLFFLRKLMFWRLSGLLIYILKISGVCLFSYGLTRLLNIYYFNIILSCSIFLILFFCFLWLLKINDNILIVRNILSSFVNKVL